MSIDDAAIDAIAQALAARTSTDPGQALAQVRAAADQMIAPTPEQLAQRALLMRLNARLAGRVFVPARSVRRRVKR